MRRVTLLLATTLVGCSAEAPHLSLPLPTLLRSAQLQSQFTDYTATLSILSGEAVVASASDTRDAATAAFGFVLEFADVAPGNYSFVVAVSGRRSGSSRDLPLLQYRKPDVTLTAGSNNHIPADGGEWLPADPATRDADGDGLSNLREILAGLDPESVWSPITEELADTHAVVDMQGTDMRAIVFVHKATNDIRRLRFQEIAELTEIPTSLPTAKATDVFQSTIGCGDPDSTHCNKAIPWTSVSVVGDRLLATGHGGVMAFGSALQDGTARSLPTTLDGVSYSGTWMRAALGALSAAPLGAIGEDGRLTATSRSLDSLEPTTPEPVPMVTTSTYDMSANDIVVSVGRCAQDRRQFLSLHTNGHLNINTLCDNNDVRPRQIALASATVIFGYDVYARDETGSCRFVWAQSYDTRPVSEMGESDILMFDVAVPSGPNVIPAASCPGADETQATTPLTRGDLGDTALEMGKVTAIHVGRSLAYVDANGTPALALYVGNDAGQIFVNGPMSQFPSFDGKPWTKLAALPAPDRIVAFVTHRWSVTTSPDVAAGAARSLWVATARRIYRTP